MTRIDNILSLLREAAKESALKQRFMSKIDKKGSHWLWKGHISKVTDQPQFWVNGKVHPAARVSWLITNGKAPPLGHVLKRTCNQSSCVNPEHLKLSGSKNTLKLPKEDK